MKLDHEHARLLAHELLRTHATDCSPQSLPISPTEGSIDFHEAYITALGVYLRNIDSLAQSARDMGELALSSINAITDHDEHFAHDLGRVR